MTNLVHFINIIRALKSVTIPGSLAQLGERLHGMEEVESSSLLRSTRLKLTGQIGPFFCAFFYIIGNMEKFRWCFIGVGGLSNRVARQLLPSGRHEIVSCYRRNKAKNEGWAKKFHSKAYDSAKEAILAPGVDAVYVVTPHSNHLEYAKLALSLGKPVLVEKPFAVSEKEAKELFEYAKEKNLYISEAMWTFYSPVAQKVAEWAKSGRLGKIKKAEGCFKVFYNARARMIDPNRAGGALLDLGVYPMTYMYRCFGKPKSMKCFPRIKNGVDYHEAIELQYNGFTARVLAGFDGLLYKNYAVFAGENGILKVPEAHRTWHAYIKTKEGTEHCRFPTSYLHEFDVVSEDIKAHKLESELVPHQATLDVLSMMDECRKQMGVIYPFEK